MKPQFGIRLVLLVVALIAIICAWWFTSAKLSHNQRMEQLESDLRRSQKIQLIQPSDVAKRDAEVKAIEKRLAEGRRQ